MQKLALLILILILPAVALSDEFSKITTNVIKVNGTNVDGIITFTLASGWKMYYKDPGDVGIGANIQFDKSQVKSSKLYWPKYKQEVVTIGKKKMTSNIYTKEVAIPFELLMSDKSTGKLKASVGYSICNVVCVPITSSIEFDLNKIDANLAKKFDSLKAESIK